MRTLLGTVMGVLWAVTTVYNLYNPIVLFSI